MAYRNYEDQLAYGKKYREENAEIIKERQKAYYQKNKEVLKEKQKQYMKRYLDTKIGRAKILLGSYNKEDEKYNRGQGDLTPEWIVENIFTKPCAHCGETDWHNIGCNRINDDLPHTMDNVEPCCWECNTKLSSINKRNRLKKTVYQINNDNILIKTWDAAKDAAIECGLQHSGIIRCCNGIRKSCGGFKWMYKDEYEKMKNGEVVTPPIIV